MKADPYVTEQPDRRDIDAMAGSVVPNFGTDWCGYCRVASPLLDAALVEHPQVRYLKVEDGPGRKLGRSFGVKLWPTVIFLRDGREVARLVRPRDRESIRSAIDRIDRQDGDLPVDVHSI